MQATRRPVDQSSVFFGERGKRVARALATRTQMNMRARALVRCCLDAPARENNNQLVSNDDDGRSSSSWAHILIIAPARLHDRETATATASTGDDRLFAGSSRTRLMFPCARCFAYARDKCLPLQRARAHSSARMVARNESIDTRTSATFFSGRVCF